MCVCVCVYVCVCERERERFYGERQTGDMTTGMQVGVPNEFRTKAKDPRRQGSARPICLAGSKALF
jgi:hypothetical protein